MRARVCATVNQNVLPGDETRMLAAQKRAGLAKLIGVAKTLGGSEFFAGFGQGFNALTGFAGRTCQGGFQAVGVKCPGQEVVDGDVVARQSGGA